MKRRGFINPNKHSLFPGFTLAELLIALAILGVIATFTIPKVLQTQQDSKYNAIAKEFAGTVSAAYQAYLRDHGPSGSMTPADLLPYMNYTRIDTSGADMDSLQTLGTVGGCDSSNYCVRFANGAAWYRWSGNFNGTASTNGIFFLMDPDGKVTDGSTNGPGKAIEFILYYNGKLGTDASIPPGATCSGGAITSNPAYVPPWFSWN